MTTVFIDGAAGTTGLEIARRLGSRSEFDRIVLDDAERKDPAARRDALNAADIAILCLPDDAAREAVAMAEEGTTRIIDASSAHRTADSWTYGFPELIGADAVAGARLVSNPGCYPTGFLALVAPLVRAGLLPASAAFTINAVSGYSGGGNALIARFEEDETDIAFRAYGLSLGHKHLPEMQVHAGLAHAPVFSPAVVPAYRGMVVDVPVPAAAWGVSATARDLHDCLASYYDGSDIVRVAALEPMAELLLRRESDADDALDLFVFGSPDGSQIRLVARLDNLGKGASGAAIQNLNLMAGLPQTTGLRL